MHRKRLDKIYEELNGSPEGLTTEQAQKNLEQFGPNIIQTKGRKPWPLQFIEEFFDLMVVILIIAGILAYAFGETTDAVVILVIVILNATVGFIQKHRAEKAIEALKQMISPHARVLRGGEQMQIPAEEVVVGDILILQEGDKIPADARIIEAHQLETNEATLTGESSPVVKNAITLRGKHLPKIEHRNSVFMGTMISHGTGKAIVFAIGEKTEFGKIAHLTATTKQDPSPLQKELKRVGIAIAIITGIVSIALFLAGYFIQGRTLIDNLLFTISVAVAAVPEGLPATITIALALGVQSLASKKAIVKQLSSVETLGGTTVILSDKTGTLTKNEMTVKEIYLNNINAEVRGVGYTPEGEIRFPGDAPPTAHTKHIMRLLAMTGTLCSEAKLNTNNELIGDPTEGSILALVLKAGFTFQEFENSHKYLEKLPFDSERKRMSVVVKNLHNQEILVLTKGALEQVLEKCTGILLNDKKVDLTKTMRTQILKKNDEMAKRALRVIAFAYREMPRKQKDKYTEAATENNLTFIGLVGMMDPPRRDVSQAIALTKEAGIRTYIVTGDSGLTASAIARQIGLLTKKDAEIITGEDLNKISDKKLKKLLQDKEKEIIFARVSPQHKLKLTNILKELGEIVAVTGDGVNDAPALKRADIGIAMGLKGTDVSKEAANMILADDSFTSIVRAIEEGRTIYQNIRKFILYIFSCNVGELIIIFTAIMARLPAPLTAVLILAVNVGTDILPALALGVEPPEKDFMSIPPRDPKKHILNPALIARLAYLGVFIAAIVIGIFVWNLYRYGWSFGDTIDTNSTAYIKSTTIAFATLVVIQLFNAYNARSANRSVLTLNIFKNAYLLGAVILSFGMLYSITEIPALQQYLGTTSITGNEWIMIIMASSLILFVEEIRKLFLPSPAKPTGLAPTSPTTNAN